MQKQLLFIPGPVTVSGPVLAAMARPMINHRGPEFAELITRCARRLRPIFGTSGEIVILGCSGTGGLEASVCNLFGRGSKLLAAPVGVFGQRLIAIARTWGCEVEVLETQPGGAVDPAALARRLRDDRDGAFAGILLTHNETSTGVQNDMAALAAATRDHPATVVVDSVSGLGAGEFKMDAWRFDIVVTASQKALAVPPGIAMLAVSDRAWARMAANDAPRFYLDLPKAREFALLGQTAWTPPVSIIYALDVALEAYEREGAANVHARHEQYARAIRAAAEALGLRLFSREDAHSVTVVAIEAPAGVDTAKLLGALREERGVVFSGGQKDLKGKIFRIGTMGDITQTDVLGALGALEMGLIEQGHRVPIGAGVRAALEVFLGTAGGSPIRHNGAAAVKEHA
jgi:aspartate aminotransferase-like enzyme